MKLLDYFSKSIGVDLGTANSLVYVAGRGIVINEPSIAAINNKTGQVLAIGEEAKKMVAGLRRILRLSARLSMALFLILK